MASLSDFDTDPDGSLATAAKLNLVGGGVTLLAGLWLVYEKNNSSWTVEGWWVITLFIGSIVLALAGATIKIVDSNHSYMLKAHAVASKLITTDTTPPANCHPPVACKAAPVSTDPPPTGDCQKILDALAKGATVTIAIAPKEG